MTIIHSNTDRGTADYGWLKANYSFSFNTYFNKNKMNFGALRVLNDDFIKGGGGFPTHPHQNMEIITIPLKGALEHRDSMGNQAVIRKGEVQVMSAGTGINHSEFNHSKTDELNLLQIWVYPNKKNVTPRYDEVSIASISKKNKLYQILSPSPEDQGVWIHQDAWFLMGEYDLSMTDSYQLKNDENGVYLFVIQGQVQINDKTLISRDAAGITDSDQIEFSVLPGTHLLIMEVPMNKTVIT